MARQQGAAISAARPRPRPQPRTKAGTSRGAEPKRTRRARAGVAGGLAWIVGTAVLLAGIVALNVAVLRLNVQLDRLNNRREQLRAGNAALESQVSSASSSRRIQELARERGLVPAYAPTFVDLGPRRR